MKYEIVKEYVDIGESGAKQSRPQLNVLMSDAKLKLFDGVLVWKFDRFSRSLQQLVDSLNFFKEKGINFFSYTEQVDTTTATGRAFFNMVGTFAQFERELITERVREGVAKRRREGKLMGRGTLITQNERQRLENAVTDGYAQGLTLRVIADGLVYNTTRRKVRHASLGFVHKTIQKLLKEGKLHKRGFTGELPSERKEVVKNG
jgi:DNA invertase Pin-like site-specific DNA recombinase